jgi:hypothetical protein
LRSKGSRRDVEERDHDGIDQMREAESSGGAGVLPRLAGCRRSKSVDHPGCQADDEVCAAERLERHAIDDRVDKDADNERPNRSDATGPRARQERPGRRRMPTEERGGQCGSARSSAARPGQEQPGRRRDGENHA